MHDEPTPPLKQARGTTLEEPAININEESDLEEEETMMFKEVEGNYKSYREVLIQNFIKKVYLLPDLNPKVI
ncbi:hypothetical protein CWI38_1447p0020 [Hamiltosporidium tvaerminnensis]|uniref:Uncharacterized protein n=1 Tax=Hamiltosporidium tvaerminnensis TaxID=1176355 RepID=A0A4Q9LQZ1_9MICR|nr:hypothetical protein CWI38_1447p0020 [Hamiltosporidium tvaerminnensis]